MSRARTQRRVLLVMIDLSCRSANVPWAVNSVYKTFFNAPYPTRTASQVVVGGGGAVEITCEGVAYAARHPKRLRHLSPAGCHSTAYLLSLTLPAHMCAGRAPLELRTQGHRILCMRRLVDSVGGGGAWSRVC